jgi:hypothetical protein
MRERQRQWLITAVHHRYRMHAIAMAMMAPSMFGLLVYAGWHPLRSCHTARIAPKPQASRMISHGERDGPPELSQQRIELVGGHRMTRHQER